MENFRCQCKKIVCQLEGDTVIIKCRHCKRYIYIHTKGLVNIEYRLGPEEEGERQVVADLRGQR
ncbi:MAG: hypothetical protein D9V47_04265 [Clostridia bacterium]|nr:MAG: hypothetical protein D9V47_04265 [Clostridia bacterium]